MKKNSEITFHNFLHSKKYPISDHLTMTQLSEKDQLGASSVTSCQRRSTGEHKLDEASEQDPKFISQSNNLPESGDDSGEVTLMIVPKPSLGNRKDLSAVAEPGICSWGVRVLRPNFEMEFYLF
jgi:hypothetical protein